MLLILRQGEEQRLFCIEYHNEDHRTRAERKIDKYEIVCMSNERAWQEQWDTYEFPKVLTVFNKPIVGEGYQDKLKAEPGKVQFYGKLLKGVLQNNLSAWVSLNARQKESIL